MCYSSILAYGKMDAEAAREFQKNFHLSDELYDLLKAPGLSTTKLYSIENRDYSGFFQRLQMLHMSHRSAMKFGLKAYEMLAGCASIGQFQTTEAWDENGTNPLFVVPELEAILPGLDENMVDPLVPRDEEDIRRLVKREMASHVRMERLSDVVSKLLNLLNEANETIRTGAQLHAGLDTIMWAGLTASGQHDIAIKECREADIKDLLTESMKMALKSENRDRSSRQARHRENKLLSSNLNSLVKQEASTKSSLAKVIKHKAAGARGSGSAAGRGGTSKESYRSRSPAGLRGPGKKPRTSGKGRSHDRSGGFSRQSGSGGGYKGKNKSKGKGVKSTRKQDSSKDANRKGESVLLLNFLHCWASGLFSALAIASVSAANICLQTAVKVAKLPIAGRASLCLANWNVVSGSGWIRNVVRDGYKLLYTTGPPPTPHTVANLPTDEAAGLVLDNEVAAMLAKKAIVRVDRSDDQLTSCFFARPKKQPGKWRPIVSLKFLNKYLRQIKFRMTTLKDIKAWVRPGYWCCSIDLTDAYFTVPLNSSARKYTRFQWRDIFYEFTCIMFGLSPSARVFTKVVNAAVSFLRRSFGMLVVAYLDDFIIQASTFERCLLHTEIAILVLQSLGFGVNFEKSSLTPKQQIEHLGFLWDTTAMSVSVPPAKTDKFRTLVVNVVEDGGCSADQLRSLIGKLESLRPAVEIAPLYIRSLQAKLKPLLKGRWRGSRFVPLSQGGRADLAWWTDTLSPSGPLSAPLRRSVPDICIMADASGVAGWGGHSSLGGFCQGSWSAAELRMHINRLELRAGHQAVARLAVPGQHIELKLDSSTAVAYINKMGGTRSSRLNTDALDLWHAVLKRGCWIRAVWTPRDANQLSDLLSKTRLAVWEFSLQTRVAERIWREFFRPTVDLFASRESHLLPVYYSLRPDSAAAGSDALAMTAWPDNSYAFPPAPLILSVLQKIDQSTITVLLIVPEWRTALWWDLLQPMLVRAPLRLGWFTDILTVQGGRKLPFLGNLVACRVQGRGRI